MLFKAVKQTGKIRLTDTCVKDSFSFLSGCDRAVHGGSADVKRMSLLQALMI